ncbi:hypothetical protein [Urbifossiella limnaea]|uniref:Uncharacterized protein n=1 Tax=Urbifossiella limnaea TaxID=2528023 RepID=A0A517Y0N7_9BACT|nr:hypothetical protein [Urbifossiella limnaea]QDU23311.1 hypothetical protein ETAA1_53060 [Urbifossiella limnaea]
MKDYSRSLRARVGRLEAQQPPESTQYGFPSDFWDVLCGGIPLEEADPESRRIVSSLYEREEEGPDPVEEAIAALEKAALL